MHLPLIIFGAGQHGHVVVDAALLSGRRVPWILDDSSKRSTDIYGINVITSNNSSWVPSNSWDFVVAIGENQFRSEVVNRMSALGGNLCSVIHPSSVVSKHSRIDQGCTLLAGVIVNPEAHVGSNVILNTGTTIDHHCQIGKNAHICPGVHLAGNVSIGEYSMLGTGAVVKPGISIGRHCIVGAGSVVVSDLPDNSVSVGIPAKVIRYQESGPSQKKYE